MCVQDIGSWVRFPDTLHEGYGHMAAVMGKLLVNSRERDGAIKLGQASILHGSSWHLD